MISPNGNTEHWEHLRAKFTSADPIFVTKPTLPSLDDYTVLLGRAWAAHWVTNEGALHKELEARLRENLETENLSLFCNGTIALLVALRALDVDGGEVITTPFTFPATPHSLYWNGVSPVFADIDPVTLNLAPRSVEPLINSNTKAILPVHVFGVPCDVDAFEALGRKYGLPIVYDAAHAFGVRYKSRPIASFGDISMFSFHATKLFSTAEGGALSLANAEMKTKVDYLKNFGIADEETVIGPGINGKMNELEAAMGLLQLENVENEIAARARIAHIYCDELSNIPGLQLQHLPEKLAYNHAYFPVLIDSSAFGVTRDEVYAMLRECNINTRKYFYPLCSQYACYRDLPSAAADNLPVAERIVTQVLCLPIYGTLHESAARQIAQLIRGIHELSNRQTMDAHPASTDIRNAL